MGDRSGAMAIFLLSMFLACICAIAAQSTCSISFGKTVREFDFCDDLPSQGAKLAYTFSSLNSTLGVAFSGVASSSRGWVGWGINPTAAQMIGTSALVAFQAPNGSTMLDYKLTVETQGGTLPSCSPIDLVILDRDVYIQDRNVVMYAVIQLPKNQNIIYHVWNRGPGVTSDFKIQQHPIGSNDLQGRGIIAFTSGTLTTVRPPHQKLKNIHGIMNVISWGILLPLGVMSARYVRQVHDSAWFYLHVTFQSLGYIFGVFGWAIGLRLGSYSKGVVRHDHRNIGITLFVFGTLQVLAGAFRPDLKHKFRPYWNFLHRTLGSLILILAVVNIFKGLEILDPGKKWKNAYIGVLVVLAISSLVLEAITWLKYFKKREEKKYVSNGQPSQVEI